MSKLNLRTWIFFIVLSLAIIFADGRGVLDPLRSVAQVGFSPLERVIYDVRGGFLDLYDMGRFWKSGEARIKNLEQKNFELQSKIIRNEILENENGELRKQLGTTGLKKYKLLPAPVLGKGRYLSLAVGERDGVRKGQVVVYLDNLIGRVVRTTARSSFVELPTDSGIKIPVKLGATSDVRGITIGQFNSTIILDQIAQNEELNVLEMILTSGEGGGFIPDLMVGRVEKIISGKTELFKRAEVAQLVKSDRLKMVFVILN